MRSSIEAEAMREHSRSLLRDHMPTIAGIDDLDRVPELLGLGEEFVASEDLSPAMVAGACRRGFLPMALTLPFLPVLLIKSHLHRFVLTLSRVHVPRNARRYARGLRVYVDRHFEKTLAVTIDAHPDSWIIPDLYNAFAVLHTSPIDGMQTHSVEVYHGDELVAGEVGYQCGPVYTSLSGFHYRNGAGTVQLLSLAWILANGGAQFWDLGMEGEYKTRLGARPVERDAFLRMYLDATRLNTTGNDAARGSVLFSPTGSGWDCYRIVDEMWHRRREQMRRNS